MAFTLAHPAAVLPLRKLPFVSLLPLIIGSMTPDLVAFLPFGWESRLPHSHSPIGTVLIDLPLGYLLLALLLGLRTAVVTPLWEPHRDVVNHALDEFGAHKFRWLVAAPSLMVGSWTHIVWDRFTHESHWTSHNLPILYRPLFPDAAHELPLYHFLQYATSVVGLAYIAWQYVLAVKQAKGEHAPILTLRESRLHLLAGLVMVALASGVVRMLNRGMEATSIYLRLSVILKTALLCFGCLYLLTGLIMASRQRTPR